MTAIEFSTQMLSYESALKPFAYVLTGDRTEGEDLVQDTFYRALANHEKFQTGTNFKAWLMTIMKNIFINNYRKNSKRPTVHDTSETQFLINSAGTKVRNGAEMNILREELNIVLNTISEEFTEPFMMYFKGFKYHEIAEKLNLPLGTVKSRIFLARKEMQRRLKSMGISNSSYN
jgi:RNA polymerase sigma-70 factor (ECF subfamily)